mgnify:CR=1 FL=1
MKQALAARLRVNDVRPRVIRELSRMRVSSDGPCFKEIAIDTAGIQHTFLAWCRADGADGLFEHPAKDPAQGKPPVRGQPHIVGKTEVKAEIGQGKVGEGEHGGYQGGSGTPWSKSGSPAALRTRSKFEAFFW